MRILGGVAAKCGENPHRRRGQGSSAMLVSRGLVGPKCSPNRRTRKGSRLIFLHAIQPLKSPECRNGEKGTNAGVGPQGLPLIRGAREKDVGVNPFNRTKN